MKVLLCEAEIQAGVRRLAHEISNYYQGRPLTIVGVLNGSIVLLADLIRQLDMPLQVALVQARSYRGRSTMPGVLAVNTDALPDLARRHVLLVDDIFDTGFTLLELMSQVDELGPASVRSAVLLRKQGRARVSIQPDCVAFDIPDQFVVGYGLDYNDLYRNLPYVAILDSADLAAGAAGEEPPA